MSAEFCKECHSELTNLDKSLTRKLISRGSKEFYCKKCLAKHFDTTEQKLDEMAEKFKEQGCSLFT